MMMCWGTFIAVYRKGLHTGSVRHWPNYQIQFSQQDWLLLSGGCTNHAKGPALSSGLECGCPQASGLSLGAKDRSHKARSTPTFFL